MKIRITIETVEGTFLNIIHDTDDAMSGYETTYPVNINFVGVKAETIKPEKKKG